MQTLLPSEIRNLELITTKQAAILLQVTEEHIRRMIRAGKLPGVVTIANVTRIRTAQLLNDGQQ